MAGRKPRLKLVAVEDGITAIGFRHLAAVARQLDPAAEIYFLPVGNLYSLATHLFPDRDTELTGADCAGLADELAAADLLCFSSMTASAPVLERVIRAVREKNPEVFIVWGGAHAIIHPGAALAHADAICTGEGEAVFTDFYRTFAAGGDYRATAGMWFAAGPVQNPPRPLDTVAELAAYPPQYYGLDCRIYDRARGRFRAFTPADYRSFNSVTYRTVWTIGCPFSCRYCANDIFLRNHPDYARIRAVPVDNLLREIAGALALYPFIATVIFYDDNFIAMPLATIREFAQKYRERIGLPFCVFGIHPNYVTAEKIECLVGAGMNRTRMGIQSASANTLAFYIRPTPPAKILEAAGILAAATRRHGLIPPAFDIISDNPVESRADLVETLQFLYELDRPYTLTLFSLRVFPQTGLWDYYAARPGLDEVCRRQTSYLHTDPTIANITLYLLAIARPPAPLFRWLLRRVRAGNEPQPRYPVLHLLVKAVYLSSRAFAHLVRLDFSVVAGPWGYYAWKLGLLRARPAQAAAPAAGP